MVCIKINENKININNVEKGGGAKGEDEGSW